MSSNKVFKCLDVYSNEVKHLPIDDIRYCHIVNTKGTTKKEKLQIRNNMLRGAKGYTEHLCKFDSEGDLLYFAKYSDIGPTGFKTKYIDGKLRHERMVGRGFNTKWLNSHF